MAEVKQHDSAEFDASEQELANLISRLADQATRGEPLDLESTCRAYPQFETDLRDLWGTLIVTNVAGKELGNSQTDSHSSSIAPRFDLPCEFGEYTLEEEIGRGGMGIVYRARGQENQPVAIKMILKGDFATAAERERFDSEAAAAAKLDHPNIIPIKEVGEHNGRAFFCMELIEGQALSDRLARGPLLPEEAARIMSQISQAIHHAHKQGVLHRDLKPSNILLDREGNAFVADFGLAKQQHGDPSLTRSGAVLGTPAYMSPEQAAGLRSQIGVTSDVYSLGAILYHMLTGHPPFMGSSPVETMMMVIEQDPISPRALNRHANRELEMIAMRCLQKPQDLRYASSGALAEDISSFMRNESVSARIGRLEQVVGNVFRETHHAAVLENWGLLWMWHSLVLLVASFATQVLSWSGIESRIVYGLMWTVGLGAWAIVFWVVRRRMGPVMFVERQIAHVWAGSMLCVALLFPLEAALGLEPLELAPLLGALAGMTFLMKAGILSGAFYIPTAVMFATSVLMALLPPVAMILFGLSSAACFFLTGLKYYRKRKINAESRSL